MWCNEACLFEKGQNIGIHLAEKTVCMYVCVVYVLVYIYTRVYVCIYISIYLYN